MSDRELLKMALDALNHVNVQDRVQVITTLRERLARVEDDPDPLHLSRILHELAGAASMCWTPRPSGVFDSQEAIKHVESAIAEIRERLAQPKDITAKELLKELLKELYELSASEEIAERAAEEIKKLEKAFNEQKSAAVELARQRDLLVNALIKLKADIYRCERGGLEGDIDYALDEIRKASKVV
jgi:hypothetical protein